MKRQVMIIFAALVTATAGCHKGNSNGDALQTDLNLANQANSQRSLDSISAVERGYASPAPGVSAARTSERYASPARRTTRSSSSGTYESAPAPAPAPTTVTVKNTKRDAAIGAAAGAIIGATTSHDKVKGGIIGAAAGGILGGVIGNNVDVKKKKSP